MSGVPHDWPHHGVARVGHDPASARAADGRARIVNDGVRRPGSLIVAGGLALVGVLVLGLGAGLVGWIFGGSPGPASDALTPPPPGSGEGWEPGRIRVEVLNGSGRPGIAGEATDLLRDAGFDVVYFGNADRFDHEESIVLDRVDNPAAARAAARVLGIAQSRLERDPDLHLHASIVLGRDWHAPQPVARSSGFDRIRAFWLGVLRIRRPDVGPDDEPDGVEPDDGGEPPGP